MADTVTAHYSWVKPEVGASGSTWGNKLNTDLDGIDNQVFTANTRASACLPKDGSETFTGNMSIGGTLSVTGAATFTAIATCAVAPTLGGHLTNKTYVDALAALKLNKAGDTMTGLLVLSADPAVALGAVTKQYADAINTAAQTKTINAGTGLTGGGALSTNPTLSIAAGGVGATQLASDAVTTAKILDANVTPAKLSQPFTAIGSQSATGASITFSGIPSWARRVTIVLDSLLMATSDTPIIQLGTSGGAETTNYASTAVAANGGNVNKYDPSFGVPGPGFVLTGSSGTTNTGQIVLSHIGGNVWVAFGNVGGYALNNVYVMTGRKALAAALTQVIIKSQFGANLLSGAVNVFYE
jgi:hypothetical protein